MKKTNKILGLIAATAIILSSCSMEKRQHLAGYHIEWKHKKSDPIAKTDKKDNENKTKTIFATTNNNQKTETQITNYITIPSSSEIIETRLDETSNAKQLVASTLKSNQVITKKEHIPFKKLAVLKAAKKALKTPAAGGDISKSVYIILAIFIPFVAVGLATDWGMETVWNILWCLLCGIPGIIHAFIILKRKGIL